MNAWTEFQKLINTTYSWVGQIDSISVSSNTIIVKVPNSDPILYVHVKGPVDGYALTDYVFMENNKIIGKAPNLRVIATEELF